MQNPNELTDDELMSVADDPALKAKLTPSEMGRLSSLRAPRIPRDQRGLPMVTSNTSDAPNSPLMDMLGALAHPQTFTDFARLLTLPVDSVKKALAGAMTMHAARTATAATGQVVKGAGDVALRGAAAAGDVVNPDVIGAVSPRAGKVVELAQKVRAARTAAKAAQAAPPAVAPVAETAPAVAPVAQTATNTLPNQKLLNELAIAARRVGVKLTPETEQAAIEAVGKGASPMEAVGGVKPTAPAAVAPVAAEPPPPASTASPRVPRQPQSPAPAPEASPVSPTASTTKIHLSAAEAKEFGRLLRKGKSEADAWELIRAQRGLTERLGLPTAEQARLAVADRNATGRWEEPR